MTDAPNAREEQWDFYPCRVEDADATILLDLWFSTVPPPADLPALYLARVHMIEPDDHGLGTDHEAEAMRPIELQFVEGAGAFGLVLVGRMRTRGLWQLAFYGPAGQRELVGVLATRVPERRVDVLEQPDAEWSYYRDFLLPDEASRQWMECRHLVDELVEAGDSLATARPITHWAYFPTADARDTFLAHTTADGFANLTTDDDDDAPPPFCARVSRADAVTLDRIYEIVLELGAGAEAAGGEYDGWETSVIR